MANFVAYGSLTAYDTKGVGKLFCLLSFWERVSTCTNFENFTEIGPQTFEKTPFKHAPRSFGLSFFSRVVTC